jgi:hypothetical protein
VCHKLMGITISIAPAGTNAVNLIAKFASKHRFQVQMPSATAKRHLSLVVGAMNLRPVSSPEYSTSSRD